MSIITKQIRLKKITFVGQYSIMKKDRLVILVLLIFQSLFSQSGELLGVKEEKININGFTNSNYNFF